MDWPIRKNIESLQLTLDYKSNQCDIYLDEPPQLILSNSSNQAIISSDDDEDNDESMQSPATSKLQLSSSDSGEEHKWFDSEQCISPTTRKPIELRSRVRNLFFIK